MKTEIVPFSFFSQNQPRSARKHLKKWDLKIGPPDRNGIRTGTATLPRLFYFYSADNQ